MPATQPRLGSDVSGTVNTHYTLLPHLAAADGYSETRDYRGGIRRMANGTATIDLVNTSAKLKMRLAWPALTNAQKTVLETAFGWIDDSSAEFLSPTNVTYTVNRDPDSPGVTFDGFMAGDREFRWRCTMYLEEA
jgi:hypothetical protein